MNWTRSTLFGAVLLLAGVTPPSRAHELPGSALQLFAYQTEVVPAPINGTIAPDGQEDKWRSAYVRSIRFASADGSIVKDGTLLLTSHRDYLYLGIGFNSQSAGNVNYARVYFDQNHDHVLNGSASAPGEYFVQVQGASPATRDLRRARRTVGGGRLEDRLVGGRPLAAGAVRASRASRSGANGPRT